MFPQVGMEKLNLTQQKHAFINQKKRTTTPSKHTQKSKARLSQLLRHPAWKWREPIRFIICHTLADLPLTYSPGPTRSK